MKIDITFNPTIGDYTVFCFCECGRVLRFSWKHSVFMQSGSLGKASKEGNIMFDVPCTPDLKELWQVNAINT